jgi:hypothetical protein
MSKENSLGFPKFATRKAQDEFPVELSAFDEAKSLVDLKGEEPVAVSGMLQEQNVLPALPQLPILEGRVTIQSSRAPPTLPQPPPLHPPPLPLLPPHPLLPLAPPEPQRRESSSVQIQSKVTRRTSGISDLSQRHGPRTAVRSRSSVKQRSSNPRGNTGNGGGGSINAAKAKGLGITILGPRDKTSRRAYDFGCSASQKHTCACQLQCTGSCDNALELCSSLPGCKFISMSAGNVWATLKRGPTNEEMQLLHIEGRDMSWEDLGKLRPSIQKEAALHPATTNMHAFADVAGGLITSLRSGSSDSPLCGKPQLGSVEDEINLILQNKLGIIALSYRTPSTLQNSMQSWMESGLLRLVAEKIAILNDPLPIDVAIAQRHGFVIVEPKHMGPDVKMAKKNVITIGTAFYHGLAMSSSDYVLFLEKDFKMDVTLEFSEIKRQLLAAVLLLERGISIVRMRSRKEQGCGTFRECRKGANKPNWSGETTMKRRRNWWSFYCDRDEFELKVRQDGLNLDERMAQCIDAPNYRCFTSWDSNWSLNAVIVRRSAMLRQKFKFRKNGKPFGTLADYGRNMWEQQDAFEVGLLQDDWGELKVPLCISYEGIFIHEEIDG